MQKNVDGFDRAVRIIAGVVLITLGILKVLPIRYCNCHIWSVYSADWHIVILHAVCAHGYFYA